MDWISNDNDLGDIIIGCGLIDVASNNKQFGFSTGDKCSMMEGLDEWLIENVHMWDGSSNIIFNASVRCDNSYGLWWRGFNNQRAKLINVEFIIFFFLYIN